MKCPGTDPPLIPIPSRTTQKSTRPRASDGSMCCQPGNRHGLQASETDRSRRDSIWMQSRWNHARSAARAGTSSSSQGLEGKEISSPSENGTIMICRIADWQARRRELRATREVREMREIKPRVLAANSVRQQSLVGKQFPLRQLPQVLWKMSL